MTTIITSLMHFTNDGRPTGLARAVFYATLSASNVKFTVQSPCAGYWYADDGTLYTDETELVTMHGSETAIRSAVARFGEKCGQLEMLFVPRVEGFRVGRDTGREGAMRLAKEFGGATLLPEGDAISLRYASLVAGVDYSDAEVVR